MNLLTLHQRIYEGTDGRNVESQPDVNIQVARARSRATARVLRPDDSSYARLWKLVNDRNHGRYKTYQTRTRRPIPLVVVSPAPSADPPA